MRKKRSNFKFQISGGTCDTFEHTHFYCHNLHAITQTLQGFSVQVWAKVLKIVCEAVKTRRLTRNMLARVLEIRLWTIQRIWTLCIVSQMLRAVIITRLVLASILGPFWVYLLKFTLLTPFLYTFFFSLLLLGSHPGSLMHYLGLLELPVWICDALRSQHTSITAISSLDFLLLSCLLVRSRNALLRITKYMSSTGKIRNFGWLRVILWNGFNRRPLPVGYKAENAQ